MKKSDRNASPITEAAKSPRRDMDVLLSMLRSSWLSDDEDNDKKTNDGGGGGGGILKTKRRGRHSAEERSRQKGVDDLKLKVGALEDAHREGGDGFRPSIQTTLFNPTVKIFSNTLLHITL